MKNFVKIFSKVLEIIFVLFSLSMLAAAITSLASPQSLYDFLKSGLDSTEMNVLGFSVQIVDEAGNIFKENMFILFASSIFAGLCMTMIFRNINLIYRTAEGKTWFSKGETPFQKDIVRMVREIGIFSILTSFIQLMAQILIRLVTRNSAETSLLLNGFIFGFIIISISEFFAYGLKLEEDVEGLV